MVLRGRTDAFYLTTPEERAQILGEFDVDVVLTHEFNEKVSALSARDFILILKTHFEMRQLWIGPDFALGHNREGNVVRLRELGEELDFTVNVVEPLMLDDQVVSSSRIRNYLRDGNVEEAHRLLSRPYLLTGVVVEGDGRGKSIGIPTANLNPGSEKLIPGNGVYACLALVEGKQLPAATNIGYRPTFDGKRTQAWVETHILDFNGDLYGQQVTVKFLSRLRGEQKFNSVQDLVQQIHKDINDARQMAEKFLAAVSD